MTPVLLRAVAAAWLCLPLAAAAANIRWSDKAVEYAVVEAKDLRMFLREFAAQQGMAVSIDADIKGELSGRYNLSPRSMMELLARTYGLVYYYDGKVLHVHPATAVESDVIRLTESTPAQFQRTLDRLGISDLRYPLTADPERSTVMVSGPRRMVELIRQAAAATQLRSKGGNEQPETGTRVFALRYAFAQDHVVRSGGKDYPVPGVASILRQTFGLGWRGGAAPSATRALPAAEPPPPANLPVLPVLQSPRRSAQAAAASANSAPVDDGGAASGGAMGHAQLPMFTADARINAIVVRDIPSRLAAYEELIARLDQRPQLVELEVNIVEVNSDDFQALGVDWKVLGSKAAFEVGSGSVANNVNDPRGNTPDPLNPLNPLPIVNSVQGAVMALVTGGRSQLIARISALQQGGRANVRAQPRLTTLNNIEAVLESVNTLYVRVEGFQDAQLFDINVGTSIRLTPSVVEAVLDAQRPGDRLQTVRMLVRIEDGAITEQSVDRVPVVQRSNIGTQAIVADGATLLIAGYSQERQRELETAVPGLSQIPVLGHLFKSKSTGTQRLERLFMITPRVLDSAVPLASKPVSTDKLEQP
jgi:type III secretion protein C